MIMNSWWKQIFYIHCSNMLKVSISAYVYCKITLSFAQNAFKSNFSPSLFIFLIHYRSARSITELNNFPISTSTFIPTFIANFHLPWQKWDLFWATTETHPSLSKPFSYHLFLLNFTQFFSTNIQNSYSGTSFRVFSLTSTFEFWRYLQM